MNTQDQNDPPLFPTCCSQTALLERLKASATPVKLVKLNSGERERKLVLEKLVPSLNTFQCENAHPHYLPLLALLHNDFEPNLVLVLPIVFTAKANRGIDIAPLANEPQEIAAQNIIHPGTGSAFYSGLRAFINEQTGLRFFDGSLEQVCLEVLYVGVGEIRSKQPPLEEMDPATFWKEIESAAFWDAVQEKVMPKVVVKDWPKVALRHSFIEAMLGLKNSRLPAAVMSLKRTLYSSGDWVNTLYYILAQAYVYDPDQGRDAALRLRQHGSTPYPPPPPASTLHPSPKSNTLPFPYLPPVAEQGPARAFLQGVGSANETKNNARKSMADFMPALTLRDAIATSFEYRFQMDVDKRLQHKQGPDVWCDFFRSVHGPNGLYQALLDFASEQVGGRVLAGEWPAAKAYKLQIQAKLNEICKAELGLEEVATDEGLEQLLIQAVLRVFYVEYMKANPNVKARLDKFMWDYTAAFNSFIQAHTQQLVPIVQVLAKSLQGEVTL